MISIVLRPLPVAEPDRLARLHLGDPQEDAWAYRVWEEIDRRSEDVFAGAFASSRTVRDRRVGREPVRRGPLGQRRILRDARGAGAARPCLHPCGRPVRVRRGRPGGRSQPPAVARLLRWRRQRHRTPVAGQRHALHGDRRYPTGVLRADGRPDVRRSGSRSAANRWCAVAGPCSTTRLVPWLHVTLRRHPSQPPARSRSWTPYLNACRDLKRLRPGLCVDVGGQEQYAADEQQCNARNATGQREASLMGGWTGSSRFGPDPARRLHCQGMRKRTTIYRLAGRACLIMASASRATRRPRRCGR